MSRFCRTELALAALLMSAPPALALTRSQTFEVGGPNPDFATVAEAIASAHVQDGDVLLVHPGSGPSFTLDKALAILAPAGGSFFADSVLVKGVSSFTLSGLHTRALSVEGVPLRGRLHAVEVGVFEKDGFGGVYSAGETHIAGCAELVASDCLFRGRDACYPVVPYAAPAVDVTGSRAVFAGCGFFGGKGAGAGCPEHYPTSGFALGVFAESDVTLAGCELLGGASPWDAASPALRVDGATVSVRGSAWHSISAPFPALAVDGDGTGRVSVSGVPWGPAALPAWVKTPLPAEPYLVLSGSGAPGTILLVEVFGPSGQPVLLAGSTGAALLHGLLPLADPVWLDPGQLLLLVPLVAAGQHTAVAVNLALPPDPTLAGLDAVFQAAFLPDPTSPGALSNPDDLVLGW